MAKKTSAFDELRQRFEQLGWYNHYYDLMTIVLKGGFERFSGRATETWEFRYEITVPEIPELKIENHTSVGITLDAAAQAMLEFLDKEKK